MEVEEALLCIIESANFDWALGVDAELEEAYGVRYFRDNHAAVLEENEPAVEEEVGLYSIDRQARLRPRPLRERRSETKV